MGLLDYFLAEYEWYRSLSKGTWYQHRYYTGVVMWSREENLSDGNSTLINQKTY